MVNHDLIGSRLYYFTIPVELATAYITLRTTELFQCGSLIIAMDAKYKLYASEDETE